MSRTTIERIYFSVYEEMPKDTQEITDAYYSLFGLVEKYFGTRSEEHEDFYRRIHDLTSAERMQAFNRGVVSGMSLAEGLAAK